MQFLICIKTRIRMKYLGNVRSPDVTRGMLLYVFL